MSDLSISSAVVVAEAQRRMRQNLALQTQTHADLHSTQHQRELTEPQASITEPPLENLSHPQRRRARSGGGARKRRRRRRRRRRIRRRVRRRMRGVGKRRGRKFRRVRMYVCIS